MNSISPVTIYPMVDICCSADLQPGDTWAVAHPLYSRVTVADGGVLAYNTHLRLNAYLHVTAFAVPRRVMRTGKMPRTILDALPSEADEEAIDNQRKSRCQWTK